MELKSGLTSEKPESRAVNEEVEYLEDKRLDGGLLNHFVKPSNQIFKKKIVNGKLQVEYDSEAQNSSKRRNPAQPISFNNNRLYKGTSKLNNSKNNTDEIRSRLYSNRNRTDKNTGRINSSNNSGSYLNRWQKPVSNSQMRRNEEQGKFNQQMGNMGYSNDPASNLILIPQFQNNRSHLDSSHTLRSPYHGVRTSNQNSVKSVRSRTADTLNRRFIHNQYRPIHMYTRFQPSLSKYEHDMIRLSQSKGGSLERNQNLRENPSGLSRFNTERMGVNSQVQNRGDPTRSVQETRDNRVFQSIPAMNNIYSFSNLRAQGVNKNPQRERFVNQGGSPGLNRRNMQGTLRKAYTQYPSNAESLSQHPREMEYAHNNFLYGRPSSVVRSHQNFPISRNKSNGLNKNMRLRAKPNGRSNVMAMFFRKILVFNSKLEGLKQKLFAPNSGFDCQKLFRDFAQENPEHLSMQELMSLFNSLDFNYSPQIVYKILLYLLRQETNENNALNQNTPSKKFELTGSGRLLEVLNKQFRSMTNNVPKRSNKPHSPNSDHLDYSKFEAFFCPMKEAGTVLSDETLERSLHGARAHEPFLNKEAIFHLVRQIVILSLRKLEDLGWVIRSLRMFPPEHLFQILGPEVDVKGQFSAPSNQVNNLTSMNKIAQNKLLGPQVRKMRNSLTFQNIPDNENIQKEESKNGRSNLLNRFLTPQKKQNTEVVKEFNLQKFLKTNGVDFLTGDLIFIFKELGCFSDAVNYEQFSGYLTADLWSL